MTSQRTKFTFDTFGLQNLCYYMICCTYNDNYVAIAGFDSLK